MPPRLRRRHPFCFGLDHFVVVAIDVFTVLYLPTHSSLNSRASFKIGEALFYPSLQAGFKSFSFILRQGVEEDDVGDRSRDD